MSAHSLKKTLLDLESRGWDSLCNSTGGDYYGGLMTDDAVMVLANGMVMDRNSVVESLGQAPPWSSYEISEERVIPNGSDSACLVYVGKGQRDGEQPAFVAVMSSVYRREDDGWRLSLYQQTPIP